MVADIPKIEPLKFNFVLLTFKGSKSLVLLKNKLINVIIAR